jgi:hypothetical protein
MMPLSIAQECYLASVIRNAHRTLDATTGQCGGTVQGLPVAKLAAHKENQPGARHMPLLPE